jgi:hypothetical protein
MVTPFLNRYDHWRSDQFKIDKSYVSGQAPFQTGRILEGQTGSNRLSHRRSSKFSCHYQSKNIVWQQQQRFFQGQWNKTYL